MTIKRPYTNEFGQVINPGDKVGVITTTRHYVNQYEGVYIGYITTNENKRCQVLTKCSRWHKTPSGNRISTLYNNFIFKL